MQQGLISFHLSSLLVISNSITCCNLSAVEKKHTRDTFWHEPRDRKYTFKYPRRVWISLLFSNFPQSVSRTRSTILTCNRSLSFFTCAAVTRSRPVRAWPAVLTWETGKAEAQPGSDRSVITISNSFALSVRGGCWAYKYLETDVYISVAE